MNISVITLFPEMFTALNYGVVGRAFKQGRCQLNLLQLRDFTDDPHQTVDDRPFGGGPGMLLLAEPLLKAIQHIQQSNLKIIYPSPQGKPFDHAAAKSLSQTENILFIAGRYEGIDERVIIASGAEEYCVGNFVVSGGELPIMLMCDAMIRLLPGVLGDENSAENDSFVDNLLDYPHYTRPRELAGFAVPDVLLSGNHASIDRFRHQERLGRTYLRRPDLFQGRSLSALDHALLTEFLANLENE